MKKLLIGLFLLLSWVSFGQSSIQKNYFTTNDNPALSITNGNLISTNIYVSNIFATNITVNNITNVNEFRGRTEFVTNLFATNTLIQYLTNNFFYTTNVTEQFVTNQLSYITNLYGPFITNNTLYSTNIFTTNLFATYVTNNTDYITNLYGPFITNNILYSTNIYVTNLTANYITNDISYITNLYSSNIFTTNLFATNIFTTNLFATNIYTSNFFTTNLFATTINATTNFNTFNFSTNLYSTNIITTNLFATYITNDTFYSTNIYTTNLTANYITNNTLITTNLYVSNVFATNITVDVITNNLFVSSNVYTTNLYVSNIFTTNITLMAAIWNTNKWNGPTNDVSFKATYQSFVASTDMEITGYIDSNATNANTSVLELDPGGANRVLYFPAVFTNFTSDGMNAYLIPSTNKAVITLFQYGNIYTNVTFRLFGPGTLGDTNFAYTDKPNAFSTVSSNAFLGPVTGPTNLVWGPDFSKTTGCSLIATNGAFTLATPINLDATKTVVQWIELEVTNSSAVASLITSPSGCATVGTPYVTNTTTIFGKYYPFVCTNFYYIPER